MAFDQTTRNLVKSHHKSGKTAQEIYKCLNKTVHIRTIQRWIKFLTNNNDLERKKNPGRPRTIRWAK